MQMCLPELVTYNPSNDKSNDFRHLCCFIRVWMSIKACWTSNVFAHSWPLSSAKWIKNTAVTSTRTVTNVLVNVQVKMTDKTSLVSNFQTSRSSRSFLYLQWQSRSEACQSRNTNTWSDYCFWAEMSAFSTFKTRVWPMKKNKDIDTTEGKRHK